MSAIVVDRDKLHTGLGNMKNAAISGSNLIPILTTIMFECIDNELQLTATDLDITITQSLPVVGEAFSACIPSATITNLVNHIQSGSEITLSTEGEYKVKLECGSVNAQLECFPASDFPKMTKVEDGASFTLPSHEMGKLLNKTLFAAGKNDTRPYLNGVYLHTAKNELVCVGLDGHRLSRYSIGYLPETDSKIPGVIIPTKTVVALLKLLEKTEKEICINISERKIQCEISGTSLASKVIDATFPEYDRMIEKPSENKLSIDTEQTARAIQTVCAVFSERDHPVTLTFSANILEVRAAAPGGAIATQTVKCKKYGEVKDITIGVNAKYILDALAVVKTNEIQLINPTPGKELLFRIDHSDHIQVVMPRHVA